MTKLEWVLANGSKLPAELTNDMIASTAVVSRFIVDNLCPSEYGLSDTECCYATACKDCWDEEVWE